MSRRVPDKLSLSREQVLLYACGESPMPRDVLWHEGDWRCELHSSRTPDDGRLLVYFRERVATAESVKTTGTGAPIRAEILRLRVVRGHLLPPPK